MARSFLLVPCLLVWIAYSLRAAGIALMAAWVVESLCKRRWRQAGLRVFLCALPVLAWQAHVWRVKASPAYDQPAYAHQRADYQFNNVGYLENMLRDDFGLPGTPIRLQLRKGKNPYADK